MDINILSIGGFINLSNTCLHRHWALKKIASKIDKVNTRSKKTKLSYKIAYRLFNWGIPVFLPDHQKANKTIKKLVQENEYDVIWIDKGNTIHPKTLLFIKKENPNAVIVSYTADNMVERHNQSYNFLKCVPLYNYHITTKSYIIDDLKSLGAQNVIFTNQSFESTFHYPRKLSISDQLNLAADIGFVGTWEKERSDSIEYLAKHGLSVRVFGTGNWLKLKGKYPNLTIEDKILYGEEYAKSFKAFKISLCFLRKINLDKHTSRTMEIPACGGFMIAERTDEHKMLFEENKEAVYFSSNEELLAQCRYYLDNDEERKHIAQAGTLRCKTSGYSNIDAVNKILKQII